MTKMKFKFFNYFIIAMLMISVFGVYDFGGTGNNFVRADPYTGETPTELSGDYDGWIEIVFLQTGVFKIPSGVTEVEVLVVAGGAGGGWKSSSYSQPTAGGGGAGGLIWMSGENPYEFSEGEITEGEISVTIGSGGAGATAGNLRSSSGQDSKFGSLTAKGGGAAGSTANRSGLAGGSGGGAGGYGHATFGAGGSATQPSQSGDSGAYGYGNSGAAATQNVGGGGGGAGGAASANSGGSGKETWTDGYIGSESILGADLARGGTSGVSGSSYTRLSQNTGDGGHSRTANDIAGFAGAKGIVIVRYYDTSLKFTFPVNEAIITDDLDVNFTWNNPMDFELFHLQISKDNYSTLDVNVSDLDVLFYNYFLDNEESYYARVRGYDGAEWSEWSEITFSTDLDNPEILITFPLHEATLDHFTDINFTWIDPLRLGTYHIQIADNELFDDPIVNVDDLIDLFYETDVSNNEIYYARVRGNDGVSWGDWSDTIEFTTAFTPNTPTWITEDGEWNTSLTPFMEWSDEGALIYEIRYNVPLEDFLTFTENDTWMPPSGVDTVEVLAVAGGGGAAYFDSTDSNCQAVGWDPNSDLWCSPGAGGAGGLIYMSGANSYELDAVEKSEGVNIVIGAGGAAAANKTSKGSSGGNTIFGRIEALGGGGGGATYPGNYSNPDRDGVTGGSGGGGGIFWDAFFKHSHVGDPGLGIQRLEEGDSGTYGWGSPGSLTNAGGANRRDGVHTTAGRTVWGVTYAAGGQEAERPSGYPTLTPGSGGWSHGGYGGPWTNPGSGGQAGAAGIVIIKYDYSTDIEYVNNILTTEYQFTENLPVNYREYSFEVRACHSGLCSEWGDPLLLNVGYMPDDIPNFTHPPRDTTQYAMQVYTTWQQTGADFYQVRYADNIDFNGAVTTTFSPGNYLLSYLANGLWYLDIRAQYGSEWSDWRSEWDEYYMFNKTNAPNIPAIGSQSTQEVTVEWTPINGAIGYEVEVYEDIALTILYTDDIVYTAEFTENYEDDGSYYIRVRAYDDHITGEWSNVRSFSVTFAEREFNYSYATVNYYSGSNGHANFRYQLSDIDEGDIIINIIRLNLDGTEHSLLRSLTFSAPGSTIATTIPNTNHEQFPFKVTWARTGEVLSYHFVAPQPLARFYQPSLHKMTTNWSPTEAYAIGIGNVVYYNPSTNMQHDPRQPIVIEQEDYVLLHYSMDDYTQYDSDDFTIKITKLGSPLWQYWIDTEDILDFQYVDDSISAATSPLKNFIVLPTAVGRPEWMEAQQFGEIIGMHFDIGVYDYAMEEIGGEGVVFGESVFFVTDVLPIWDIHTAYTTIIEGRNQTTTFIHNSPTIFDTYRYMWAYDSTTTNTFGSTFNEKTTWWGIYSNSRQFAYEAPLPSFQPNIIRWVIGGSDDDSWDGGICYTHSFTTYQDTWIVDIYSNPYEVWIEKNYTVTAAPDSTDYLQNALHYLGLGTTIGRFIFSAVIMMISAILLGIFLGFTRSSSLVISLVMLLQFAVFSILGFIPLWIAIVLVIGLVLAVFKMFFSGGGGEA